MVSRSVEGRLVGRIGPLGRLSRGEYGLMDQGKNIDRREELAWIFDAPDMGTITQYCSIVYHHNERKRGAVIVHFIPTYCVL